MLKDERIYSKYIELKFWLKINIKRQLIIIIEMQRFIKRLLWI